MKPIIRKITPFDANEPYEVKFSWSGGQIYGNRLIIYETESLTEIYNEVSYSTALISSEKYHIIPEDTLINGTNYIAQISVITAIDADGVPLEESDLSDKTYFKVLTTPEFKFDVISESSRILLSSSSYAASVIYYQAESEPINSYKFQIFNSSMTLLSESATMYDRENISYTYQGLENNGIYYIRCVGDTVNGIQLATEYIEIDVKYKTPSFYTNFYAENDREHGWNSWYTNIIVVSYHGDEELRFTDDGKIDLSDKILYYNDGFNIKDDFTIVIVGENLYKNKNQIFNCYNADGGYQIKLTSFIYDDGSMRFRLNVDNGLLSYVIYSKALNDVTENSNIEIWLRRKENLYSIETYVEGVLVT